MKNTDVIKQKISALEFAKPGTIFAKFLDEFANQVGETPDAKSLVDAWEKSKEKIVFPYYDLGEKWSSASDHLDTYFDRVMGVSVTAEVAEEAIKLNRAEIEKSKEWERKHLER